MNKNGRFWQVANSIDQAKEWAELYLRRGAIQVDLKPQGVTIDEKLAKYR